MSGRKADFADLTMDKLIFQMRVPMTGTNSDIIWNLSALRGAALFLVMGLLVWLLLRKPERIFNFRRFHVAPQRASAAFDSLCAGLSRLWNLAV